MAKTSDAKLRAQKKYDEAHRGDYKGFYIKCNRDGDADIIEYINQLENKNSYIKELIRSDMKKNRGGE